MATTDRRDSQPARNRRYPSDPGQTPEETDSDPTTLADESTPSWRDRIKNNRLKAFAFGGIGLVAFLYVTVIATRMLPAILANPLVQAALYTLVVFLVGVRVGKKRLMSQVLEVDKLQLKEPNRLGVLFGDYLGDGKFRPIKGWTRLFRRPKPYTVGDLSEQYPDLQTKAGADSADPAIIGLQPGQVETCQTDMGRFVCQETATLEPSPWIDAQDVTATFPETGGADTIRELKKELKRAHERIATLEELVEVDQDEREMLREQATKRRADIQTEAEEWKDTLVVQQAASDGDSSSDHGGRRRNGHRDGLHNEVTPDE